MVIKNKMKDMSEYKICEVCGQEKHISDFSKSYKGRCKKCVAVQMKEKRKKQTIRDLIKKAEEKENELSCAVQEVERNLIYVGFIDCEPSASMCNGSEFVLDYQGSTLDVKGIIECMEQRGYIMPCDFIQ